MRQALPLALGRGRDAVWPWGRSPGAHTEPKQRPSPWSGRTFWKRGARARFERSPSRWSGRSPGNFVVLAFVFLPTRRSTWPPSGSGSRVRPPDSVHLPPGFVLPSSSLQAKVPTPVCHRDRASPGTLCAGASSHSTLRAGGGPGSPGAALFSSGSFSCCFLASLLKKNIVFTLFF